MLREDTEACYNYELFKNVLQLLTQLKRVNITCFDLQCRMTHLYMLNCIKYILHIIDIYFNDAEIYFRGQKLYIRIYILFP